MAGKAGSVGNLWRRQGRWERWALALAITVLLGAWGAVPALARTDALADVGSSTVHVPYSRLYAFSVSCAALPCRIALTERATAGGRPSPGLDISGGAVAVMKKRPTQGAWAVWFVPSELNHARLDNALKQHGAVVLHVTGTLIDATGARVVATRNITLLPAKSP